METTFPEWNVDALNAEGADTALLALKAAQGDEDRSLELAGSDFLLGC
jgi:hypothetical protein